jgi:hypothetical protein
MLRSAPLLRRDALLIRDPFELVGPGSAEQREQALHRVRDTGTLLYTLSGRLQFRHQCPDPCYSPRDGKIKSRIRNFPMPIFSSPLSLDGLSGLLFAAILLMLIPLAIWLIWDLDRRRLHGWRRRDVGGLRHREPAAPMKPQRASSLKRDALIAIGLGFAIWATTDAP